VPPDDIQANYTVSYDLMELADSQVYLVLKDYSLIFIPQDMKAHLDNLFNGNKVLGERRASLVANVAGRLRAY
jgi:hypothetical protein